ncbi:MAG: 23S rRNA (uracil(1939)-C(5))-methyltransferase RlmD [Candidatus Margulisbacteria bacterium]|jgi:23S rRNA (uracil-5-)-methyltransferase RumA|nr:23S rRNA (uracil(1939)-C(5))-methyltransferase RlmD [Candidatus Margulisiibacteriota bacterium]
MVNDDRQVPPCPYFGRCGGCAWQDIKYTAQLQRKEEQVRALFGACRPIIPSPDLYYYRNRMDYAFGPEWTLGLKASRFRVIDLDKCLLMSEQSNELLLTIKRFAAAAQLPVYEFRRGLLRHVVIREGKNIGNTIVNILTSDQGILPAADLWSVLGDRVVGLTWSINRSPADRSAGDIQQTFGQDYYEEKLAGLTFRVPVQSFFQTNVRAAENIIKTVKELIDLRGAGTLLDLYSGTGSIGLSLAASVKQVIGIEENKEAVELSRSNAGRNAIDNYAAHAGRAEDILPTFKEQVDLVVVDPPRPGLHKKVVGKLGELKARQIIYVSCNPLTQKNDVEMLLSFGYKMTACQPLDLFPHTPHLENIISLAL